MLTYTRENGYRMDPCIHSDINTSDRINSFQNKAIRFTQIMKWAGHQLTCVDKLCFVGAFQATTKLIVFVIKTKAWTQEEFLYQASLPAGHKIVTPRRKIPHLTQRQISSPAPRNGQLAARAEICNSEMGN